MARDRFQQILDREAALRGEPPAPQPPPDVPDPESPAPRPGAATGLDLQHGARPARDVVSRVRARAFPPPPVDQAARVPYAPPPMPALPPAPAPLARASWWRRLWAEVRAAWRGLP